MKKQKMFSSIIGKMNSHVCDSLQILLYEIKLNCDLHGND